MANFLRQLYKMNNSIARWNIRQRLRPDARPYQRNVQQGFNAETINDESGAYLLK